MRKELGQLLGQRGKLGANHHYHWPVHSYYVILRAIDLLGEHVLKLCYCHGTTAVGRVLKNERYSLHATPLFRRLLPRAAEGPPLEEQRKLTQKAISVRTGNQLGKAVLPCRLWTEASGLFPTGCHR